MLFPNTFLKLKTLMLSFKYLNQNMTFPHKKLAFLCPQVLFFQSCLKFEFLHVHNAAKAVTRTQRPVLGAVLWEHKVISRKKDFYLGVYIQKRLSWGGRALLSLRHPEEKQQGQVFHQAPILLLSGVSHK